MRRLGILGSTRGTGMLALIDAINQKKLSASIEIVVSNQKDAQILERAHVNHLCAQFVDSQGLSHEAYDNKVSAVLEAHQVDLIVLVGYMRILSNAFIDKWRNNLINVHPSLLPKFAGKMDKSVHQAVLDAKEKETGCTVHYVTEDVDAGPILIQKKCPVLPTDTVDSLKERVQKLEGEALIEAVKMMS
jgi:phosphoribosylglycinamide formyltransferase-1